MKQKAKKAKEHKVSILGKTIPTALIIGVFLIGGGSAALLSSFGTVSGTADVDQPIALEGGDDITGAIASGSIVGGERVATDQQFFTNSLDDSVEVGFDTEIKNTTNGDRLTPTSLTGASASTLVFQQNDNNLDGSYGISVSTVDPLSISDGSGSDYAVSVESDGSSDDYATVWYSLQAQDFSSAPTLKVDAETSEDHSPRGLVDEVFVVTTEGEVYGANLNEGDQDSGTAEITLPEDWAVSTLGESSTSLDYGSSELVAIGLGYGDASQASSGSEGEGGSTVDVTFDNVRVGGTNIDESTGFDLPVRANETLGGYLPEDVEDKTGSRYGLTTVADFDPAIIPGNYKVMTSLVPETEE